MNASTSTSFGSVADSSRRYASATTALSETIVNVEAYLNSLPGKREAAVSVGEGNHVESLRFARGKEGQWSIYYAPPPLVQLAAMVTSRALPPILFRNAPVDVKLRLAPLLDTLLAKINDELASHANQVESAVSAVQRRLGSLPRGGQ